MTHLFDTVPEEILLNNILTGHIRFQTHPTLPLRIYGYTEKAQFEKKWDVATLNCRGLITDNDGNVVARPWKKFFNYGEGRLYIDDTMPVEVTDKMDGSLGILYQRPDYDWDIATRGSFASDQANHASMVLHTKHYEFKRNLRTWKHFPYTLLFEIVYPANRIVLDYKGLDDLVLLGAVHTELGYYVGPREAAGVSGWDGPVTEVFEYRTIAEAFAAPPRENAEGYVVRSGTEMVKIKQVDYVELHKIVTNLNPRTVWLQLGQGKSVGEICEVIPDEFHGFVRETAADLKAEFDRIEHEVLTEYVEVIGNLPGGFSRKEFAQAIKNSRHQKYLFTLLDCRMIDGMIWQSIRPSVERF